MHGQRHFGELGTHAQQSRAPHPEHRARPADGDRARHTGDVAGADGTASAVHTAWNGVIAPSEASFAEDAANGRFDGIGNFRSCKKPVRTLSSRPTPMMQTIAGMPQIKLLTARRLYISSNSLSQNKIFFLHLQPSKLKYPSLLSLFPLLSPGNPPRPPPPAVEEYRTAHPLAECPVPPASLPCLRSLRQRGVEQALAFRPALRRKPVVGGRQGPPARTCWLKTSPPPSDAPRRTFCSTSIWTRRPSSAWTP